MSKCNVCFDTGTIGPFFPGGMSTRCGHCQAGRGTDQDHRQSRWAMVERPGMLVRWHNHDRSRRNKGRIMAERHAMRDVPLPRMRGNAGPFRGGRRMTIPTIYHGTPLTPRAALNALLPGRAACVSFWHPQDVEAVEAVCPAIMFRQWRLLRVARRASPRRGMVHQRGLDALFRLARAAAFCPRPLGGDTRRTRRALTVERRARGALAVRGQGSAALAHGWTNRATVTAVRALHAGLPGLDRNGRGFGRRLRSLVPSDGRDRAFPRQSAARTAPHARRAGGSGIRLHHQRRRDERGAERMAL